MKNLALLFISMLFVSICHANTEMTRQIDNDIENYQQLVEQAFSYREQTIQVYRQIQLKFSEGLPLTGEDIETLNSGMQLHLELRKDFYEVAYYYEYLLDSEETITSPENSLKGIMLSLSAALTLYDNYLLAISIFEEDTKLRRYLNSRKKGYNLSRSKLTAVTLAYNSVSNRQRVRQAINYFKENWIKQSNTYKNNEFNQYLYTLITQSESYKSTLKVSPLYVLHQKTIFFSGITGDTLAGLTNNGINLFSLLFGNSVGFIKTRNGHLFKDTNSHDNLSMQLKAGDILLEKTPFRLTDKLIPGYWGHVAIWVGTESELKKLGIWNHPVVKQHHDAIKNAQLVVEALRTGVELNPLRQFMNVDDLAVLRHSKITKQQRADTIIRSLRQVGKAYDFNFDIESNDRIVCSELIYVAYSDVNWPTQATLGRHTISPTHVANLAGDEKLFDVISLYIDGKSVDRNINSRFRTLN